MRSQLCGESAVGYVVVAHKIILSAPVSIGPFGIRTALGLGLGLVRLGLELDKCISWITTMFGKC